MPSKALDKKGVVKELFNKMDHQEILDGALPLIYQAQLHQMEWNIYEESYAKTVDKLESIEPSIKVKALKEKEMLELKEKTMAEAKCVASAVVIVLKKQQRLIRRLAQSVAKCTKANAGGRRKALATPLAKRTTNHKIITSNK